MTHEFRLNDKGRLDEFVAHGAKLVHLEQMDVNSWWIGVTLADGSEVRFNFHADKGLRIQAAEDWRNGREFKGGVR